MSLTASVTTPMPPPAPAPEAGGRFWLLWHWLSLDAVAVLMAYQWAAQESGGVALPAWTVLLLGGGVWLGYVADRLVDVAREPALAARSRRHAFHRRHLRALLAAWSVLVLALLCVGWLRLPRAAYRSGSFIALLGAIYVLAVPRRRPRPGGATWRGGKRLAMVAVLTLAGVWWLPWADLVVGARLGATMAIFALAAWWSVALMHHRTVAPLSWYGRCERLCLVGIIGGGWIGYGPNWAVCAPVLLALAYLVLGRWPRELPAGNTVAFQVTLDGLLALSLVGLGLAF